MTLNKLAEEVHQNAVDHGWWEEERSFGEIIALCHSELSEALEEYRAGRPMVWHTCGESLETGNVAGCAPKDQWECRNFGKEAGCEYRGDKPEGIAVELADCIIRILDWLGKGRVDVDALLAEAAEMRKVCDLPVFDASMSFGDMIAHLHILLSMAYLCWKTRSECYAAALHMAMCINDILEWAAPIDEADMELILGLKHQYNKGRPYRHGGKVL